MNPEIFIELPNADLTQILRFSSEIGNFNGWELVPEMEQRGKSRSLGSLIKLKKKDRQILGKLVKASLVIMGSLGITQLTIFQSPGNPIIEIKIDNSKNIIIKENRTGNFITADSFNIDKIQQQLDSLKD